MPQFKLVSDFRPQGDQPQAIQQLVDGFQRGDRYQTLLGVTGSGKTYSAACVVEKLQRPVLVVSHNKTLAAQLYSEFSEFFPENEVHYFVSFYDYYQPEAYIPQTDTFIEKDLKINDEINRLRLAATTALLTRRDVIIVASVSCIYGIGSPDEYEEQRVTVQRGHVIKRRDLLRSLVDVRYQRNDVDFSQGTFRARGDVVEVFPAYANTAYRIELFGDEIDRVTEIDTLTGEILNDHDSVDIFPAKHFMTDEDRFEQALLDIELELQDRIEEFTQQGKLLEAQRIEQRTRFDLEMLREAGYCQGIENYSRHFSGLKPGEPPYCLLNFFPEDYLVFVDESHVTLPQIKGMYRGDRSRKQTLVDYGFRLPSAIDNRPLRFEEFENLAKQALFISATPADFERTYSSQIVEQLIRPTGLVDPQITVHSVEGQIDHLIGAIQARVARKQRTLVITLTKRMSEDLADYLTEMGIRVRYLHSEIDTLERPAILKELREGRFDVLVGINLLREGLDLPEVSLVAILDADKEGFLRTETSLIQTAGRAARHVEGEVILYADKVTEAMANAIRETDRRRKIQLAYNEEHQITPESIEKNIRPMLHEQSETYDVESPVAEAEEGDLEMLIEQLTQEMQQAATELDFERAAVLRDQIQEVKGVLDAGG